MLTMRTDNFFGINKTKEVKCLQTLKKKNSAMFTFSFSFFEKACQQQQQPNTYFFFQKEVTKSWFENKWEVVFFFLFPHLPKKKGLKNKLFCFFLLNKNIVRFGPRTRVQVIRRSCLNSLCFFASGNKKTFTFLPLAS